MTKQKLETTGTDTSAKRAKHDNLRELSLQQKPIPEVYLVRPKQPKEQKQGQLSKAQLDQFYEKVCFAILLKLPCFAV